MVQTALLDSRNEVLIAWTVVRKFDSYKSALDWKFLLL